MLKAPYYAVVCAIVGLLFAAVLLLASFLVHVFLGLQPGTVNQVLTLTAKYIPLVMAVGGFFFGLMPNRNIGSAVFGSARWANRKEIGKNSRTLCFSTAGLSE